MRIEEHVFFAPGTKLEDLRLDEPESLIKVFRERVEAYYFNPIRNLIDGKMAFAAGALQCILIDAFARYALDANTVGSRFKEWCINYIQVNETVAATFYDIFRCGLLHEGHIKRFGQFSFDEDFNLAITEHNGFIVVNPMHMQRCLEDFFNDFLNKVSVDITHQSTFINKLAVDFGEEIKQAGSNSRKVI